MHNRFASRKALPLLLLFALLIVSLAVILPMVVSADAKQEMDDFNCQTLTTLNLANPKDDKTELRFLCTIGSLEYKEVGFVFSKTNTTPTIGGGGCKKVAASSVHSAIIENGEPRSAGVGRYWVALKLVDIPHAFFDSPIYVSAYVVALNGTIRYSDAHSVSVCEANGHTHTVSTPDYTIPASVLSKAKKVGHCAGCNLDNVTQTTGGNFSATELRFKSGGGDGFTDASFDPNVKFSTVRGSDHFYPTEGYPKGKDFYFEIDLLWNSTIANSPDDEFHLLIWNSDYSGGGDKYNNIFLLAPKDNADGCWCKFAGGFDYGAGTKVLDGPAAGDSNPWGNYPNIESTEGANDYGWHRLGVRLHQEAAIVEGAVVNSGVAYLYIDGLQRWAIQLDMAKLNSKGNLLFIASIDPEDPTKLKYEDNDGNRYFDFWAPNLKNSETEIDMVFRNAVGRVVDPATFDTGVMPIYDPPSVPDYTLQNGSTTCAKVYFTEKTTVNLFDSKNATGHPCLSGRTFTIAKTVGEIRGDDHFYPDAKENGAAGKDLWFEYSLYWNPSLYNWDVETCLAEIKVVAFRKTVDATQKHREFYLLYTRDNNDPFTTSGECPYAGHFDFSTYLRGQDPGYACVVDLGGGKPYYKAGWGVELGEKEAASPAIGGYGWHRIGFRYHQEVASISDSSATYSGYTELYIDGEIVWKVKTDMQGSETKSLKENSVLLWEANVEGGEIKSYTDNTDMKVEMRIDRLTDSSNTVFFAVDDPIWTIGGTGLIHPTDRFH